MEWKEWIDRRRYIILDGGMGTMLQARGLPLGARPELLALENPGMLEEIHREYALAGADLILANTFGASPRKLASTGHTVGEIVPAAIRAARKGTAGTGALVALDIGPLGELLEPAGSLTFEEAYENFRQVVLAGREADAILIETMTDLYELKAALLAAKENSSLSVLVSMSFEENGRTFTGCTVESFGITAAALGADGVGINCSLGPVQILPFARRLCRVLPGDMPVFIKANAGLPRADGSGYDVTPAQFRDQMLEYRDLGISGERKLRDPDSCLAGIGYPQLALHSHQSSGGVRGDGGRGANQPHRKKAVPAGAPPGRYGLYYPPGSGTGPGRGPGAGCECGPARH